jgi:F-box-like
LPRVTVCSLPDDVLLDIFEFCLPDPMDRARAWSKLVHVCQRWRYIVFASPVRLDLRLLCTERTPVRKMLDVWPPFPIEIRSPFVGLRVEENIIAALEDPKRVRRISLGRIRSPWERLVAMMHDPFPALDCLSLQIDESREAGPALPNTFLGGSTPRLRSLHLTDIPFPTLPQLLLSSNDLTYLHLERIPQNGYISPEAMAVCISALTSLTKLSISFKSPASRPDPITRHPPPLTRAVLPTLTNFYFYGVSEYLEDLMAQIDAPLLCAVQIKFFNQLVFDIQQLCRFICHAPALMLYDAANIHIYTDSVEMVFSSMRRSFLNDCLTFQISCRGLDWQVSSMAQICNQLSFVLSSIEQLNIYMLASIWQIDMDETQWLEFVHPFTAVQTLHISHDIQLLVVSALRGLSGESATQVLPALEKLDVPGYQASGFERPNMWPFIIARQHSDHRIVVYYGYIRDYVT